MNRWEIVTAVILVAVLAWLFWPQKAKRHEHGYLPDTWGGPHAKVLDDQLREARERRSGRG